LAEQLVAACQEETPFDYKFQHALNHRGMLLALTRVVNNWEVGRTRFLSYFGENRMPNLVPNSNVTRSSLPGWEEGFAVLSIVRCVSFFREIGLPPRIVENPEPVILAARDYLQATPVRAQIQSTDSDTVIDDARNRVQLAFAKMAHGYDETTLHSLVEWFLRYLVDDAFAAAASMWRDLFRCICGWTQDKRQADQSPLDESLCVRICQVVRSFLAPELVREFNERIKAARALPMTEWDQRLEQKVRVEAGEETSIGAIDMALETVQRILTDQLTYEAWRGLESRLSEGELMSLVRWARQQAARQGLPVGLITDHPLR